MSKTGKIKVAVFIVILALDIILLPWLFRFPQFIKLYGIGPSAGHWLKSSPFEAVPLLFTNRLIRTVWLWMQFLVFALVITLFWSPLKIKRGSLLLDEFGCPPAAGNGQFGTARWLTEQEVDNITTVWFTEKDKKNNKNTWKMTNEFSEKTSLSQGGIVLGIKKDGKQYKVWLDSEDSHAIIIGVTRSGKSRRLYLPTIWELAKAGESMIITDPKGELHKKSKQHLESEGYNVILLDFRKPRRGNRWNPMEPVIQAVECGDYALATECAWDIAHAVIHNKPHTGDPLWANGPESVLAALILNTALEAPTREQKNMTSVYYTLAELGASDADGFIPINTYFSELPSTHPAKAAFATAAVAPYRTRASFFTTVLSELRLWSDPSISDMTAIQDHEIDSIGKKKTAVFLVIPDEKNTRHVLATLYIDQSYQILVNVANENDERLPLRVVYLLDEFGNLPAVPNFQTKLTVAGGRGMRFLLGVQGLSQLKEHYKEHADTIKGNCHTWIYLISGDPETLKTISEKMGNYTVQTQSNSSNVSDKNVSSGYNEGLTGRPLLYPAEVGKFPFNKVLILKQRYDPIVLPLPDLSVWPCAKVMVGGELKKERELNKIPIWIPDVPTPTPEAVNNENSEGDNKQDDNQTNDGNTKGDDGGNKTESIEESENKNYIEDLD